MALGARTTPAAGRRWLVHAIALLLVLGLSVPSQWVPSSLAHQSTAASPDNSRSGSAGGLLGFRFGGAPPEPAVPLATEAPVPTPTPQAPRLPDWLQNHRATGLLAGPYDGAATVRELSQWHHLRPLGPSTGDRLLVEEPGDGVSRLPVRGWVEVSAVGPSGPPRLDWHLAVHLDEPSALRWQGETWPQQVTAEFAAVVDGESGALLYGKNAHGRVAPASLTKIATAILALELSDLQDVVIIEEDFRRMPDSTVMGITPGERIPLRTLLYGLMLPSGNDAALAVARHVGGSQAGFADLMNQLVLRLELENSRFANPHGLDEPEHFSSPYDMAALARYAMRHPVFVELCSATSYAGDGYRFNNLNRLLSQYEGADGVKPGYTDLAGRALVGSATRDGRQVFVVLMRSADLWGDVAALLDYAFENWTVD